MQVVEPAHPGLAVCRGECRQDLGAFEQRAVGRGQAVDGGAGGHHGRYPCGHLRGPAVDEAYGVPSRGQRHERAYLALEDGGEARRTRHLRGPQAGGHQVVDRCRAVRPQREADVLTSGRQAGDLGPPVGLGVRRVGEQPDQQLVVDAPDVAVAGAVVQPVHRQRGGRALCHGSQAGGGQRRAPR